MLIAEKAMDIVNMSKSSLAQGLIFRAYTESSKIKYTTYKNKLKTVIRIAENIYYLAKFDSARGNINRIWQIIKNIMNDSTHCSKPIINKIKINNCLTTDTIQLLTTSMN